MIWVGVKSAAVAQAIYGARRRLSLRGSLCQGGLGATRSQEQVQAGSVREFQRLVARLGFAYARIGKRDDGSRP